MALFGDPRDDNCQNLGRFHYEIDVIRNVDGRMEVFAIGNDNVTSPLFCTSLSERTLSG